MLVELIIENLAVIPDARMEFAPGLNIISGETGAGKTILAQAIALLLGARADTSLIRPDASEATVEAVFTVPPGSLAGVADEIGLEEDEYLAVRRRLNRDGRSRAYVGGRTANLSLLGELTGRMMAFSAQHEQRRLMMSSRQLEILDSFCGVEFLNLKEEYCLLYGRRTDIISQLSRLNEDSEAMAREAELLGFQLQEIDAAGLSPGEDKELDDERRRLQAAAELSAAAGAAANTMGTGDAPDNAPAAVLGQSLARLRQLAGTDGELDALTERLESAYYELEDLGGLYRQYAERIQQDPVRLIEIEERLDLINALKRKYGGSIDAVLEYSRQAASKQENLSGSDEARRELGRELDTIDEELLELAGSMRRARLESAGRLAAAVREQLEQLAFSDCGFEVKVDPCGEGDSLEASALTENGADKVEFMVVLNPGMPETPLSETASGGEMSRLMLAVKCAVSAAGETATMVFDEIDAGIGGNTGAAVGKKLKQLAGASQVICITHLPQIAGFADAHFSVNKRTDSGRGTTVTEVSRLEGGEVVDELCRMMGSAPDDRKAREHAGSLLRKASGS